MNIQEMPACNGWGSPIPIPTPDDLREYVGVFGTKEEAALAYNEVALREHKQAARINDLPALAGITKQQT